ncbi:hypothetical protein FAGAP_4369 [Fusarium agapanthi]|uniref:Uncharacterized protein n=1 Tax=Fusarium agapanthi TaxID=1803897 RepID=A0A9P5BDJ6_9HYPO|nr:hypothetical protein FAGAP_4369 [Fusarium agapanthi]
MPATSSQDIDDKEPFNFNQGFLIPANVSIEDYDFTPMVSLSHLNIRDLKTLKEPLAPEIGNMTKFDLDTRASKETRLFFSKTQVNYGCKASIRNPLGTAIHSICGNGDCNKSVVYTRKVKHMASGGYRKDTWLRILVTGKYYRRHTRAMQYYLPTNPNFQAQSCKISKFSNYIKMRKNFGNTIYIEIKVSLKTSNSHCFTPNLLKEVTGALRGIGGSFFRTLVTAMISC